MSVTLDDITKTIRTALSSGGHTEGAAAEDVAVIRFQTQQDAYIITIKKAQNNE